MLARREMKLNMPAGGGTIFHHQKSIFLFSSKFPRAPARREMKLNESVGGGNALEISSIMKDVDIMLKYVEI